MTRYMLSWEISESRMPNDPREVATGWKMLLGLVKQDLETGVLKEWGAFPGDRGGFGIVDATEIDLMKFTMRYTPFVNFKVHPFVSVKDVSKFLDEVSR